MEDRKVTVRGAAPEPGPRPRDPGCHIHAGVDHHVSQTRVLTGRRESRDHAVPSDGFVERFGLA
jgi:hypothetical protein